MAKSRSDDDAFEDDDRPVKRSKPSRPRDEDEDDRPSRKARARQRDEEDDEDDRPRKSRRRDNDEDDDERPRRKRDREETGSSNGMALAAYYCGFLSLIAILGSVALIMAIKTGAIAPMSPALILLLFFGVGGICGLLAIILGIVGLTKAGKKSKGKVHAIIGLILGSLCLIGMVVVTLMGIVAQRR